MLLRPLSRKRMLTMKELRDRMKLSEDWLPSLERGLGKLVLLRFLRAPILFKIELKFLSLVKPSGGFREPKATFPRKSTCSICKLSRWPKNISWRSTLGQWDNRIQDLLRHRSSSRLMTLQMQDRPQQPWSSHIKSNNQSNNW